MRRLKSNQSDELLGINQFWEICSWMPAKAAIKFSSLSKSLSALLSDPLFVERQSIHSSLSDGGFFLWHPSRNLSCEKLEFYVIPSRDGQTPSSTLGIPVKSLSFLQQFGSCILSSSHGLVLLQRQTDCHLPDVFMICNPATGNCTQLPLPDLPLLKSKGFTVDFPFLECHPRNLETHSRTNDFPGDYTIIAPVYWDENADEDDYKLEESYDFAVYRNGKWEDTFHLKIEGRQLRLEMPVAIFRGCDRGLVLHYICDSWPCADGIRPTHEKSYIVAYDIERKVLLRTFPLPEGSWKPEDGELGSYRLKIFKWRSLGGEETIALTRKCERMLSAWVLEDYERGRWRRVVRKSTMEIGVPWEEGVVLGNCIVNSMWLLFATRRRVYAYDMAASRLEVVAVHGFQSNNMHDLLEFTPYANTLRPVCGREGCVFRLGDH